MKTKAFLTIALGVACVGTFAQQAKKETPKMVPEMTEIWDPEVRVITPGQTPQDAPSDAIVLMAPGVDLSQEWINQSGDKPGWDYQDGVATVKRGAGVIKTKRQFQDFQLHVEWRSPSEVVGESQGRGNSGIFLQERYELQVLDNFNNRTYRNGQAGSLYKQSAPLVNVCTGPGKWQTYDVIYTAPRFNEDGTYFTKPRVTVLQNGVLVQNNTELRGPTQYIGVPEYTIEKHGPGAIILQDHGNPVSFRNIWIREL